jgi:hypothetical protein
VTLAVVSQYEFDQILASAKVRRREGDDVDDVIWFLRESGLSVIDCIKVVMSIENVGLGRAKEIVHFSAAWADTRPQNEEFHKRLAQNLDPDGAGNRDQ